MPVWGYNEIKGIFNLDTGKYILGGHSQGAKMAAQFVFENPKLMQGLFLLGTSHPRDFDLSNSTLPTVKIYAELDGLASVAEVMENKDKLPKNTSLIPLKGGNHSQFGYLGTLLTDKTAQIDLYEQQAFTLDVLISFFYEIEK